LKRQKADQAASKLAGKLADKAVVKAAGNPAARAVADHHLREALIRAEEDRKMGAVDAALHGITPGAGAAETFLVPIHAEGVKATQDEAVAATQDEEVKVDRVAIHVEGAEMTILAATQDEEAGTRTLVTTRGGEVLAVEARRTSDMAKTEHFHCLVK